MDSFEDLVRKNNPKETILDQKKELIGETLTAARKAIDYDFKPEIMRGLDGDLIKYFEFFKNLNLYSLGWRFSFGTSREWAGLCSVEEHIKTINNQSKNRNLYLSINFVHSDKTWEKNMLDTIYHEIAHAIVFEVFYFKGMFAQLNQIDPANETTQGHGKIWKMICDLINPRGNCSQFYTNAILAETFREYFYECAFCENVYYGNSRNFATNCNQCYKPIIVEKNRI
jgi:predicted SprT family Zn-dependent metalloprotease